MAVDLKCEGCGYYSEKCYYPPLTSPHRLNSKCTGCAQTLDINYDYANCVELKIRDNDNVSDFEEISVLVFDTDTLDIFAGEDVVITGNIRVGHTNGNKGKLVPFLHADYIKYQNRQELGVTDKDIESFQKFVTYPDIIRRLVSMFSPNVVGHNDKKLGILLSAVNTLERKNQTHRNRLNILFVGPPGTAKSMLGREVTKLLPNS